MGTSLAMSETSSGGARRKSRLSGKRLSSVPETTRNFDREEEFFGFPPVRFIDEVINTVNEYACNAADALEEALRIALAKREGKPVANEALQNGSDQVLKILQESIDKNFDLWELYVLKNTFVVPPEFASFKNQQGADELDRPAEIEALRRENTLLDQEIEQLKKRVLATKFMNDALEKENDALEKENERLDQHAQLLEQLSARVADSGLDEVESVLKSLVSRRERLMTLIREAQQLDVDTPP